MGSFTRLANAIVQTNEVLQSCTSARQRPSSLYTTHLLAHFEIINLKLQAKGLCERPHTLIFGKSSRDDTAKLFLGKNAVAYIARTTPGPGTYELRQPKRFSLFPRTQPGTTIGGPLANVDRVRTGPLASAYKSLTPGPGAYDDDYDRGIRVWPARISSRRRDRDGQVEGRETQSCCCPSDLTCDNRRAVSAGDVPSEASRPKPSEVRVTRIGCKKINNRHWAAFFVLGHVSYTLNLCCHLRR